LDAEGFLNHYSPELICVSPGLRIDFEAYKNRAMDYFKSMVAVKVTPILEESIVLTKDLVLSTGVYGVELKLKSGDKKTTQNIYSNVFQKAGGQWKIIYEHGSETPVTE
jgi:ketosteroid isomerase-like protein